MVPDGMNRQARDTLTRRATVMFQISAAEVLKPSRHVVEWVMEQKTLRVGQVPIKLEQERKKTHSRVNNEYRHPATP